MQEATPAPAPSAQLVGNAFVEQYYHILHQSPELVHRFYQDSSSLSRMDIKGNMTTVTTMEAIGEKIQSLNYGDYTAEIKTADSQESYEKGVIVLVTGCLTGKDNVGRKFAQTFFLAPQEKGYYVLNDVFRYIEDNESLPTNTASVNGINESAPEAIVTAEPEPIHAPDHLVVDPAIPFEEEDLNNGAEVCDPSDNDEGSVVEDELVEPPALPSQNLAEVDPTPDPAPETQEDAPKKSYASILLKKSMASPVRVVPHTVRTVSANTDHLPAGPAKSFPAPEASPPTGDAAPESSHSHEEAPEGYSIHVRNLPYDATVGQLEKEFKRFGPIKRDGIQVRSSKQQGFCFGFVEFESLSSMQSALEASPITIGDRPAVIEEKRTSTRVSGGRGRFASGRAGYRNDNFRGRGNYGGGGRSFGRNEFRNQGEFSGRARGSGGRSGDGYQRGSSNGRGGRQGGGNRSSVPPT
ncbi:hypothetical protein ACFX2I_015641 [Malus domestica]|uniref:nuclear transport factor 2-like isoform X1 n=1 Tax=Malus domestica TaxID=3750 RepID=UPI0010A9B121|nr:putative G3BP-like protein isoform X3 [Malus domestica]XP_028948180.1 putative G3BP-like protein isoform X3 [Malus domestica]